MKILLDECVTRKLKRHLAGHDVATVVEMGWSGLKNGRLLTVAAEHDFDILLTIDKNIAYQQNVENYNIAIVVMDTPMSKIDALIEFLPDFVERMPKFEKGKIDLIQIAAKKPDFER